MICVDFTKNALFGIIYDHLQENLAYGIRAVRVFSSSSLKMSKLSFCHIHAKEPFSTYLCRCLWRLTVSYKGEINLHFDLPNLYSCHTRSPLLWTLIRILYLDTARFIELLQVRSPFKLLGYRRIIGCRCGRRNSTHARRFERPHPGPLN